MRLVLLRFALGPIILVFYVSGGHPYWYLLILTLGFLSDVFDGIIARRIGVSTQKLRSLDSWADTVFYVCVFLVSLGEYYDKIYQYWAPISVLIALELIRHIYEQFKFGKSASYHMWSAKFWGICLYLGFMQLLGFGEAGYLFLAAIVSGIVTDVEGLVASMILKSWHVDVPSIIHAYKIKKAEKDDIVSRDFT